MGKLVARLLNMTLVMLVGTLAFTVGAAATLQIDGDIIDALDRDGRYLEQTDGSIGPSIDAANRHGIAFVWLEDEARDAEGLADAYVAELEAAGSAYHTVLVLSPDEFAAFSTVYSDREIDAALDDSFGSFSAGLPGRGIDVFTAIVTGTPLGGTGEQSDGSASTTIPGSAADQSSDGGIGFGTIVLSIAAIGGGFLLFRGWRGRRLAKQRAAADLEEDRIEIEEQLKNNADRVILLGDRVIASGNHDLINLYESASQTYQDVSQAVATAETAAEINALDDRIDEAEWQFEVIEARLDGRPVPAKPEPEPGDQVDDSGGRPGQPPPPPVPADQRRPDDGGMVTSPSTGRSYPRPSSTTRPPTGRPAPRTSRRGGGALGGILGGVLGNIILGGGLGSPSRRTQRRTGGFGAGLGSPAPQRRSGGLRTGGLGGGVLRRGGGSSGRRSRSKSRSGGGRSLGGRQGGSRKL